MNINRRMLVSMLPVAFLAPLSAHASDSYMPGYMAFEGKLKDSDPPAWQMIARITTQSESEINARANQLLSSLVGFVKKHGDAASGALVFISTDEASFSLWNKVIGVVLGEASSRTSSSAIEKLKLTVTLTDPTSKVEKTLQFQKQ